MTSLYQWLGDAEDRVSSGIFPTYDSDARKAGAGKPIRNAPAPSGSTASEGEKAELVRIARAEEAWRRQVAMDDVEEASMESFPCSDPPGYYASHA